MFVQSKIEGFPMHAVLNVRLWVGSQRLTVLGHRQEKARDPR